MSESTRMPSTGCPECAYVMDTAMSLQSPTARPKPGDAAICAKCAALLSYTSTLLVRLMTESEYAMFPEDARLEIYKARVAVRMSKRQAK